MVTLSQFEVLQAAMIGIRRRLAVLGSTKTNKVNNAQFGWHTDIEAACAEMAVAKILGVYWAGSVNTWQGPDAGNFQVRHTAHDNGCLIYRKDDPDNDVYILVTGSAPLFCVRGWVRGADAQHPDYWHRDGYPAWFVPQSALRPISELTG